MKIRKYLAIALLVSCASGWAGKGYAQSAEKKDLSLQLGYYNENNQLQYLKATAKTKVDGKFRAVPDVPLHFYITADSPAYHLGDARTNEKGEAVLFVPASARSEWIRSGHQSFVVTSAPTAEFDATKSNVDITKARLKIDTGADKAVTATLEEYKDTTWTPVKGVDVKMEVKRLGADLAISDAASSATDSLGVASGTYKLDSLPGDPSGNIVLVARVEDNDTYGNLSIERTVPWGVATKYVSNFDRRTLYARRGKSPLWLEYMAYGIIAAVWGILLFLVGQIRKLKRMGAEQDLVGS